MSILTFLALGYVRPFAWVEDAPLLIVGLVWGMLLAGFLAVGANRSASATHGLLAFTVVIVALLSFFAKHRLGLTLLVVSPVIFFNMQFLLGLMSPSMSEFQLYGALPILYEVARPLIFALIGWGLGSLARAILTRRPSRGV